MNVYEHTGQKEQTRLHRDTGCTWWLVSVVINNPPAGLKSHVRHREPGAAFAVRLLLEFHIADDLINQNRFCIYYKNISSTFSFHSALLTCFPLFVKMLHKDPGYTAGMLETSPNAASTFPPAADH